MTTPNLTKKDLFVLLHLVEAQEEQEQEYRHENVNCECAPLTRYHRRLIAIRAKLEKAVAK